MSNLSDLLPAGAAAKQLTFTDSGSGIATKKPVILNSDGTVAEVAQSSVSASLGTPANFQAVGGNWASVGFDSTNNRVVAVYQATSGSALWAVVGTVSGASISFGTPVVFNNATSEMTTQCIAFDPNEGKVVIVYKDSAAGALGTAIVGTVSGTTISFGSEVVFANASTDYPIVVYDSNAQKMVIAYQDSGNSNYGTAIVGTVSGTSMTFGSEVVFLTQTTDTISGAFDSSTNQVVLAYRDYASSLYYGKAIVGSVSGTAISFGSQTTFESATIGYSSTVYDSTANKIAIFSQDQGNSYYGTAVVGTVSGTSISFGTPVVFEAASTEYIGSCFNPSVNTITVIYTDGGNSSYPTYIIGTVSGTSITFGSAATVATNSFAASNSCVFDSTSNQAILGYVQPFAYTASAAVLQPSGISSNLTAQAFVGVADSAISASAAGSIIVQGGTVTGVSSGTGVSAGTAVQYSASNLADIYAADSVYDSTNNKIIVVYDGAGSGAGYGIVATISGTSVSYGSAVQYSGGNAQHSQVTYDSTNQRVVVAYVDSANSGYLTVAVGTVSGTSISWGTPVVADSTVNDFYIGIDFDINAGKVLIIWKDNSTAYNYSIVGTVSGTSISFGTRVLVDGSWGYQQIGGLTYDVNAQKHLFTRNRTGIGADAYVGTISGTSVSWGSATSISSTEYLYIFQGAYDSNAQKIAIVYRDASASDFSSQVATISGTSVSFGTRAVIDSTISPDFTGSYYDSSDQTIVAFGRATNYYGYIGTVSGTSISWTSASTLLLDAAFGYGLGTPAYDANADAGLILFANAGDSAAESAVTTAGALPLTTGTKYYVTTTGGFSSSADTPSVNAGLAISTTSLLLNGDS